MIFLDNASTTRVFDEVLSTMSDINNAFFYNPSALYKSALAVRNIMEDSRKSIAKKINAQKNELFFTSCATESNNWIINNGFKNKKGNLVISMGEHASVHDCALNLKNKGVDVRTVLLMSDGRLDLNDFEKKLDKDTSLVSVIHASNETGAINDIASIVKIVRRKSPNALIHSDGVQAFCKIKTDVKSLGVDFYTISAHKIGGPKGCGAVFINNKVNIAPLFFGGGQESGLRSGTENVPAIAGFARAAEVFLNRFDKPRTNAVFEYLKNRLTKTPLNNQNFYNRADNYSGNCAAGHVDNISDCAIGGSSSEMNIGASCKSCEHGENQENQSDVFCDKKTEFSIENREIFNNLSKKNDKGDGCGDGGFIYNGAAQHTGFILSLSYAGIKSEVLQHILSDEGVLIGLGSACSSKSDENRVLSAMGRSKKEIEGNIRLSFGVDITMDEAVFAAGKIENALLDLKKRAGL